MQRDVSAVSNAFGASKLNITLIISTAPNDIIGIASIDQLNYSIESAHNMTKHRKRHQLPTIRKIIRQLGACRFCILQF
jgi:hypothetical protein